MLTNLRSRGGAIRGDITKDKVMWLYWSARPGEIVNASTFKELHKLGLIESQKGRTSGEKLYRLSDLGRR